MLMKGLKEILQDQTHIFQDISHIESSQIHQITIMYQFEHTSYNVLVNFLFQNL